MENNHLYDQVDQQVKHRFGTWTRFEEQQHISSRNGKRMLKAMINKLSAFLRPLGMRIRIIKDDFPASLAEKLSVTTPFSEVELEPIIDYTVRKYKHRFNQIDDTDPKVIEKVTLATKIAQEEAIDLFGAIVKVTHPFYKSKIHK